MRVRTVLLAAALVLVPLAARAADLVVWWEDEFFPGENDAVREMMAAFEKKTGRTVELAFLPQEAMPDRLQTAPAQDAPGTGEQQGGARKGGSPLARRPEFVQG